MSEQPDNPGGMKQRVARAFVARVRQGNLGRDVQVVYRVAGGMPVQRVDYKIAMDSVGGAKVDVYDARSARRAQETSIPPEKLDVAALFEQLSAGLHSLMPASRAVFPPDAYVGSITISVEGDEATFYFVPEEEKRKARDRAVAPAMEQALRHFWGIARRLTETQKGAASE